MQQKDTIKSTLRNTIVQCHTTQLCAQNNGLEWKDKFVCKTQLCIKQGLVWKHKCVQNTIGCKKGYQNIIECVHTKNLAHK